MPKRVCDRAVWSVFQHKCNSGNYQKSTSLPGSLLNQYDIAVNGNRELLLFCGDQPYGICANLRKKISTRIDIDPPGGGGVTAANNTTNAASNRDDPGTSPGVVKAAAAAVSIHPGVMLPAAATLPKQEARAEISATNNGGVK